MLEVIYQRLRFLKLRDKSVLYLMIGALPIIAITLYALRYYSGSPLVYLFFSLVFNILFFTSFMGEHSFFEFFLSTYLWLGFWIKFSIRIIFYPEEWGNPVGGFLGTATEYDQALLVSSSGAVALLLAQLVRRRVIVYKGASQTEGSEHFYLKYRSFILSSFFLFYISVAFLNLYLGIYQRGTVPRTILPFGGSGVFTWLLLFGGASFSSLILNHEIKKGDSFLGVLAVTLGEVFTSNVSMLSRGFILNGGAILFAIKTKLANLKWSSKTLVGVLFLLGMAFSIVTVNHIRSYWFTGQHVESVTSARSNARFKNVHTDFFTLFVDRFVGIEGVFSVVSHHEKGWALLTNAWSEEFQNNGTSYYDNHVLKETSSYFINPNIDKHHFITLPGIMAFLYYLGSIPFLVASMFLLGMLGSSFEWFVFRLGGGNLILCSVLSQVVAYRYIHFGYAPRQSYLLFGTLLFTIFLIYCINNFLELFYRKRWGVY